MVRPDFRAIQMGGVELYHYGMPERSGRYAWGSGDRPYQRLEGKAQRMEKRLRKKFEKADKKADKLVEDPDTPRNISKLRKLGEIDRGMFREYVITESTLRKLDVTLDPELQKKGLQYFRRTMNMLPYLPNLPNSPTKVFYPSDLKKYNLGGNSEVKKKTIHYVKL